MPTTRIDGIAVYIHCADTGAVADWCVEGLGFEERDRWSSDGIVATSKLSVGASEVWLDGATRIGTNKCGTCPRG